VAGGGAELVAGIWSVEDESREDGEGCPPVLDVKYTICLRCSCSLMVVVVFGCIVCLNGRTFDDVDVLWL